MIKDTGQNIFRIFTFFTYLLDTLGNHRLKHVNKCLDRQAEKKIGTAFNCFSTSNSLKYGNG